MKAEVQERKEPQKSGSPKQPNQGADSAQDVDGERDEGLGPVMPSVTK